MLRSNLWRKQQIRDSLYSTFALTLDYLANMEPPVAVFSRIQHTASLNSEMNINPCVASIWRRTWTRHRKSERCMQFKRKLDCVRENEMSIPQTSPPAMKSELSGHNKAIDTSYPHERDINPYSSTDPCECAVQPAHTFSTLDPKPKSDSAVEPSNPGEPPSLPSELRVFA